MLEGTPGKKEIKELKVGSPLEEVLDFSHILTSERNEKYFFTTADRVDHLVLGGAEMSNAVRAKDNKIIPIVASKILLRVFSILQGFTEREAIIEKLMTKFPETGCSYCGKKPCNCALDRPKGLAGIEPSEIQKRWTMSQWQKHLKEVYGASNAQQGMAGISNRLGSEIAEVVQARMLMDRRDNKEEDTEKYKHEAITELADVFAWALATCNEIDVDLERAFVERYGKGCPNCNKVPCICTEFSLIDERKINRL